MSKWKQIKFSDKSDYATFFSEEHGLVTSFSVSIRPVDEEGNRYSRLYTDKNPYGTSRATERYSAEEIKTDKIFDTKFYVFSPSPSSHRSYQSSTIPASDAKEVNPYFLVTVDLSVNTSRYGGCLKNPTRIEKIVKNKEEFEQWKIWATKDKVDKYVLPTLADVQVGQKYVYAGAGICEVVKVYNYPQKRESNAFCKVKLLNGETYDVEVSDNNFVLNPMQEYPTSEFEQFNVTLNELKLQPNVERDKEHNLINVIWQPIEDAARYVVKLYRHVDGTGKRKVYFLKDYDVERNEHFLSISDVIVNNHVIVVVAEDRSGKVIAQSRGIDANGSGSPRWWD